MKQFFTAIIILISLNCVAQDNFISDLHNVSSTVSDLSLTTSVVTYPVTGVGYLATLNGIYQHYGPTNNGSGVGTLNVIGIWNASAGEDDFDGPGGSTGVQQITGNSAPVFGILNFQNGTGMQLNILDTAGINVAGTANFLNGITTTVRSSTSIGAMRFLNGATYTGSVNNVITASGADSQEVNGYVGKIGNASFIYPVGSGTDARPLQISAPASPTDEYDVAWIVGDPASTTDPSDSAASVAKLHPTSSMSSPILSVNPVGQWDWIPVSGTGAGLTVTVSIPDMSTYASTTDLRLVGWNGSSWIDLSGTPTASGNTENNTLSGTMVAGITAIGIGSINVQGGPLPVTLVSFTAVNQGSIALLNWQTTNQENTASFIIERSTNGTVYTQIGTLAAAGNTGTILDYSFTDNNTVGGTNYYRLKMVNKDGSFTYSEVRVLNFGDATAVLVYPNPTRDNITITGVEAEMQLRLINTAGQQMTATEAAGNTMKVNVSRFAAGTYILQIVQQDKIVKNINVVKEK